MKCVKLKNGPLELLVQRELLHERLAQLRVVVHDQDLATIGHSSAPGAAASRQGALGGIEHSGVKEQAGLLFPPSLTWAAEAIPCIGGPFP